MAFRRFQHPFQEDPLTQAAFRRFQSVSQFFDTHIEDAHHLPTTGPALLVGNHAMLGIDSWALFPELYRILGRVPRGLGLRNLFAVPLLNQLLTRVGAVPGEREVAVELLRRGELCVCYPGGTRDSFKTPAARYQLQWTGRAGFAWAAAQAQAPIIPIAAIGPDDVFPTLSEQGVVSIPFIDPNTAAPLFLPVARRVPFTYWVGEPLHPPVLTGKSDVDEERVQAFVDDVRASLEARIAHGLQERKRQAVLASME